MLLDANIQINETSAVLFAAISGIIAYHRGRNVIAWVLLGLIIQCFALVLLLVLPDLKAEEAKDRRRSTEARRLREQLRKERQVADQRHSHVEARLTTHDKQLGVDTSQPPELGNRAQTLVTAGSDSIWFYAIGDEQKGPVSLETVHHLIQAGVVKEETLVWTEGMKDWLEALDVDTFRGEFT
ncbi:MAG: DUF4339 domain-containing protein [Planctomycetota bacterium]